MNGTICAPVLCLRNAASLPAPPCAIIGTAIRKINHRQRAVLFFMYAWSVSREFAVKGHHQVTSRHCATSLTWHVTRRNSPLHWALPRFCDVSLPVPLDQAFTYSLPLTLQNRVKPGARLLVPFGTRKLTGVVLRVHEEPADVPVKDALRLIDPEPVLDDELMALGRWI